MVWFWLSAACNQAQEQQNSNNGAGNTDLSEVSFVIRWETEGIYPEVRGAEQGSWWFGLSESGAEIFEPWSGEDCFETTEWAGEDYSYCHPILPMGNVLKFVDSPSTLVPGEETYVSSDQNPERMMYYFLDALSGTCFIDGSGLDEYLELCSNQFNMTLLY